MGGRSLIQKGQVISPIIFSQCYVGSISSLASQDWDRGRRLPELSWDWENPIYLVIPTPLNHPCSLGQRYLRIWARLALKILRNLIVLQVCYLEPRCGSKPWPAATSKQEKKKPQDKWWKLPMLPELSQDSFQQAGWGGKVYYLYSKHPTVTTGKQKGNSNKSLQEHWLIC